MSNHMGWQAGGGAPSRRAASPFMLVSGLSLLAYWAIVAFVVAVDPYDLGPWGAKVTLPGHLIMPENRVLAMAVAKSQAFDLVMIGSSTAMSYTPEQIREVFPRARNPVNFSYPRARPKDRDLVVTAVARYSGAERVVIWIDWTYILEPEDVVPGWPAYMFDTNLFNDLSMINPQAVGASINVLSGRGPVKDSERRVNAMAGTYSRKYNAYQAPLHMRAVMAKHRASVGALRPGPERPCGAYRTLYQQLMPALRTLAERRKTVDLVLPPYSVVYYGGGGRSRGFDFFSLMTFRRCLAQAVGDLHEVSVWALDSDTRMITDLGNYRDPGHLHSPDALQSALAAIGDPRYRLTPENVDERNETLWRAVRGYRYTTSYSDPANSHEPRPLP